MAIYHFSAQVLGRAPRAQPDGSVRPGSSAVAAAAYRAGTRLKAEGRNAGEQQVPAKVHDYSKRTGVSHSEIMVPEGGAAWLADRELLWNAVEQMEVRRDAQLAREFNMAIPHELDHGQRLELVRGFVAANFVSRGMVADFALHDPDPEKGMSEKNFHAHVMLTMRQATRGGLHHVKTREWNSVELLKAWRVGWQQSCNDALERAGKRSRIDHRTLDAQRRDAVRRGDHIAAARLDRKPEIHVGARARQAERRGYQPRSAARPVGPAWHRERQADGTRVPVKGRRMLDYRRVDQGTRLSWLDQLLVGNSAELRQKFIKIDRQAARMDRKFLYWTRQVEFHLEGHIMGAKWRFDRARAAEEARQQKAERERKRRHAEKRRDQVAAIRRLLADILSGGRSNREATLVRQREVKGWLKAHKVERDRSRSRSR